MPASGAAAAERETRATAEPGWPAAGERGDRGRRRQQGERRHGRRRRRSGRDRRTTNGHVRRPLPEQRECKQGTCMSGFCCNMDCSGTCQTCDSSGNSCIPVASTLDPRNDCADKGKASCGSNGTGCNGSGACNLYATNVVCDTTSMCSGTGAVIPNSVCNGQGRCNPSSPASCNGFLCQSNACLTSCTDGTACVTGGSAAQGPASGRTPTWPATAISSTAPPTGGPRSRAAPGFP